MLGICSCDYADGEVPCGRSRRSGGMIQCKSEGRRTRSARARGQEWMGHPCSIPRVSSCPPPFCSMEIRRGSEGAYHTRGAGGLLPSGRNQACQPPGHPTACSGIPETNHEPKWRERKRARAGPRGHPSRFPHSTPGRASGRADEGGRSGEGCGSFHVNVSCVIMKKW